MNAPTLTHAWQAALAAEQRAVFGYGLLGAQLRASPHARLARSCAQAHEDARDRSAAELRARGAVPGPPAADYPQLYPVTGAGQAITLAVRLEDECASAWRYLYAVAARTIPRRSTGSDRGADPGRGVAQAQLNASAVRASRWRRIGDPEHATVPFPGL